MVSLFVVFRFKSLIYPGYILVPSPDFVFPTSYRYVMGIGEAEAFSERLKREVQALEAANVHAILENEPLIDEVTSQYFGKRVPIILITSFSGAFGLFSSRELLLMSFF